MMTLRVRIQRELLERVADRRAEYLAAWWRWSAFLAVAISVRPNG
jgi:hypothetical protein